MAIFSKFLVLDTKNLIWLERITNFFFVAFPRVLKIEIRNKLRTRKRPREGFEGFDDDNDDEED